MLDGVKKFIARFRKEYMIFLYGLILGMVLIVLVLDIAITITVFLQILNVILTSFLLVKLSNLVQKGNSPVTVKRPVGRPRKEEKA